MSRIAKFIEFPAECSSKVPVIEIKGITEAYVHGCRRILEYTDECVVFCGYKQDIKVSGKGLLLSDFTGGCICIIGIIYKVELVSSGA